MSFVGSNILAGASGQGGAGYAIERSLRFNGQDSSFLSRTPSSVGNLTTWTMSVWVKNTLGFQSTYPSLFGANSYNGARTFLRYKTSGVWEFFGLNNRHETLEVFRDPSAWYHLVLKWDTTNSTAADRVILYINGVRQTWDGTFTANATCGFNANVVNLIGKEGDYNRYINAYLADYHFIDGQALAPTAFGELDNNNLWVPKEFDGTYGPLVDQSQMWSNYVTGTAYSSAYPITNGFNGVTSGNNRAGGGLTFTPPTPIACTKVRIYITTYAAPANTIYLNGVDIASQIPITSGYNVPLEFTPSNNQFVSYQCGASGSGEPGWFGQIELLINGKWVALIDSSVSVTDNSFHLDFADNSSNAALGTDTSGNSNTWTVNNLTADSRVYSSSITTTGNSGNWYNTYPATNIFDATTTNYGHANGDGSVACVVTFSLSPAITSTTNVSLLGGMTGSGTAEISINGGTAVALTSGSSATTETTVAFSGSISSIVITKTSSDGAGLLIYGFKIDGTRLFDGDPSSTDSLVDSPTNGNTANDTGAGGEITGNYATLNPLRSTLTLTNGNLDSAGDGGWTGASATIGMSSGKWYWEIDNVVSNEHVVGIVKGDVNNVTWNTTYGYGAETGVKYLATGGVAYGAAWTTGDVIGIAFDADNGSLTFYKNGTSQGVAATGLTDGPYFPSVVHNGSTRTSSINFGQRAFVYQNAGTNRPSADYKALNTANLPTPTIADGSKYFDSILYDGDGNSTQTITGLNFAPDLTWQKIRNQAGDHALTDIVRGVDAGYLQSEDTEAEKGNANNGVSAFTSDGFTVAGGFNSSSNNWVTWAWDAGNLASNSAYNQSQAWTNGWALTSGSWISGPGLAFDGFIGANTTQNRINGDATWTAPSSVTFSSLRIWGFKAGANSVYVNGTDVSSQVVDGTVSAEQWNTITGISSPLSTIRITGNTSNTSGIGGVEVDGKILVDTGIIPVGSLNSSVYDQSAVWSDDVTKGTGNIYSNNIYVPANIFNGNSSSYCKVEKGSNSGTVSMQLGSTISGVTKIRVNTNSVDNFTINGGSNIAATNGYQTIYEGSAITLSDLDFVRTSGVSSGGSDTGFFVYSIEINGLELIDSGVTLPTNVPSIASTVKANPSAGFSIVSYTGNQTNGATVGHGLNTTPSFLIAKNRDASENWLVLAKDSSDTWLGGQLSTTSAFVDLLTSGSFRAQAWDNTPPTSSVFQLGDDNGSWTNVLNNSQDYIVYCFAPVEGYSAIGSYEGSGSASTAPFVYTGMRPSWIMVKNADTGTSAADWFIYDTKRSTFNAVDDQLYPNRNIGEGAPSDHDFDILSNGFKVRSTSTSALSNESGKTYVYIAFASNPFASNGGLAR